MVSLYAFMEVSTTLVHSSRPYFLKVLTLSEIPNKSQTHDLYETLIWIMISIKSTTKKVTLKRMVIYTLPYESKLTLLNITLKNNVFSDLCPFNMRPWLSTYNDSWQLSFSWGKAIPPWWLNLNRHKIWNKHNKYGLGICCVALYL